MQFQLKTLVLWPRKAGLAPRQVSFAQGKLNIITGASRTGKSAVTPILDYCLGSRQCSIPVETIRNACSWFGVVVQTPQGEKLFARREPESQRSTDDMYVLEGPTIEIPNSIEAKNANADQVRRSLDELCGLSNLDFSAGGTVSGFTARPSFRDLNAFILQPQNIIANPDVLFYKADTQEHREKLRTIFPYVLNAITPEVLAKQHELHRLERELVRKERELKTAQEVSAEWLAEIRSKVAEARELGLIADALPAEMAREEMIEVLKGIIHNTDRTIQVSSITISESLGELAGLEKEEATLSQELTSLRRRLNEMRRLKESANSYHEALTIQRDRLKVANWLDELHTGTEHCPVCGNTLHKSTEELDRLLASLKELEEATGISHEIPAAFEREFQRVQENVETATEKLRAVQIRQEALSRRSADAERQQFQAKRVERFVGGLESDLRTYERLGADSRLVAELEELTRRVTTLRREVNAANVKQKVQRALRIVNTNAGRLLPNLDVERPNDPIQLDIGNLTVKVSNERRDDYLWEIGSGSNWLSYHLAVMLGLQEFFLAQSHSVVPALLIIDQPSQVYFPKLLVRREDQTESEPQFDRDEDVQAIRKAFAVLSEVVTKANGKLQVLVLDHAPDAVWGGLPGIHLVEEWRNGRTLVPTTWLA